MKNTIFAATLAMALFCGSAFADGNMGQGGYTGCDGTNPPPTCDCNVPNPPAECQGGGFASGQYSDEATFETDYVLAAEILIGEAMTAVL
jgi:hypothetical protein